MHHAFMRHAGSVCAVLAAAKDAQAPLLHVALACLAPATAAAPVLPLEPDSTPPPPPRSTPQQYSLMQVALPCWWCRRTRLHTRCKHMCSCAAMQAMHAPLTGGFGLLSLWLALTSLLSVRTLSTTSLLSGASFWACWYAARACSSRGQGCEAMRWAGRCTACWRRACCGA